MISWKLSFRRLSEEYELAKKKKDALGNLLSAGKISQSTHSLFDREIQDAMAEIANQRKALLEKMASKMMELDEQIKTLEILVAKFEIQHVTGEVDDQIYQRETDLLSMGLETARQELDAVQEAVNQLSNSNVMMQQETEPQTQGNEAAEVEFLEEPAPAAEKEPLETAEETAVEKIEIAAESQNSESGAKSEEKQET